jgi:signal transduction histidine kinase
MSSSSSGQLRSTPARERAAHAQACAGGAHVHAGRPELSFPDVPRLELDQLLEQLVARAEDVRVAQGRLRGLLRANQMIISDLALPVVLRRLVVAARELVGARYAALGVIAADGGLTEFVHVGMTEAEVDRIGHLPQGKGLLGVVIEEATQIRLSVLGADHRSSGFPPGHPPMSSFLGVPIRVGDEVFGNLYLAESTNGEFSAEDEELATALAASAGMVIDNARLYATAQARHDWLRASTAITSRLLCLEKTESAGSPHPLTMIAESCRDIAAADLVAVALPTPGNPGATGAPAELRVEVAIGADGAAELVGRTVPIDTSLPGKVFTTGQPVRAPGPDERAGLGPMVSTDIEVGPVLIVALRGSRRMHGVLSIARRRGATGFSTEDLDMAAGFANQASVAIELAEARAEQQRAVMVDERDRIAADLHDHVIQRLFATGLSLQSVAAQLPPGRGEDRVRAAITDIDDTITQIRTTIFALHHRHDTSAPGVRARLLEVVDEVTPALGFGPALRFNGAFEDVVPEAVVEDLTAVLREALSNIARHARARSVVINITTGEQVTLEVADDGTGIGTTTRRSGLANLRRRAENHGGTLTLTPRHPAGTCVTWSIPLAR